MPGTLLFPEMPRAREGGGAGAGLDGTAAGGRGERRTMGGGAAGEGQGAISWRSFGELLPVSSSPSPSGEAGLRPVESDGRRRLASQSRGERERGELGPGSLAPTFSSASQAREISDVFWKARTSFPLGQRGLDGSRLNKSDG